ncbi:beta-glucosidase [Streptomyces durocortorensis]|uniref:Glycoside hydrolase family 3 protein n=1 Tax=Streptomyces durocortorensis TaxID=2811104 RepID=A0ABS2HX28_9ACTN|nr:glycoside hydrolase family 3 C-terminal domain-containing protein [Streptomyces durocortorensis]MBM7054323.1 glycoside hydrolase family 3 protein [Streptomyces durocortorensis]
MNRRTFLSAAAATALVMGPAASLAHSRPPNAGAESRVEEILASMTPAQKEALIRCDFAALSSLGIPALTMVDAPAGLRGETGVTAFPVPIAQAATFDTDLAARLGTAIATEARAKGFNNALGPTADVHRTWHFGRQAETLGEDPLLAGAIATRIAQQMPQQYVLPTVKHFAAYTQEVDRFFGDVRVSERALREIYEEPFRRIVAAAPNISVMMAYPKINGTFATQSPALFDDVKNVLGLKGYTVPDFWAGDDPIAAARSGMDLAGLGPGAVKVPEGGLTDGSIPDSRLDDAARRILTSMVASGLLDHPVPPPAQNVSTPEHRRLAHEAAVGATVLLTNRNSALPLTAPLANVAVIGPAGSDALTGVAGSAYVDPGDWDTPLTALRERAGTGTTVTHAQGTLGDTPLPVVPASVLSHDGTPGLAGSYYAGPQPSGTPVASGISTTLDFTTPPESPLPDVWSARWTGRITPTFTGLHRFSLLISGTAKLTVGGTTVISGTRRMRRFFLGPYDYPLQGTVQLTAGQPTEIRIEYTNSTAEPGNCGLTLGWQPQSLIPAAVAAARAADAAVVFVNRMAGEEMDHAAFGLPGDQNQLISAVAAANPRTIVVLNTDGPVDMPWLPDVEAVIQSWYGGRGMGTALAAVLYADSDPSGRLPVAFPADASQGPGTTPATYPGTGARVEYAEGTSVGYRFFDAKNQSPRFPFGHGLSYTTFALGGLEVSYSASTQQVTASVAVTNSGGRQGTEVVQLYAALPAAAGSDPRRLVAFRKVTLDKGASTRLDFTVPARDLAVWSSGAFKTLPGQYLLLAGRSSRDLTVQRAFTI